MHAEPKRQLKTFPPSILGARQWSANRWLEKQYWRSLWPILAQPLTSSASMRLFIPLWMSGSQLHLLQETRSQWRHWPIPLRQSVQFVYNHKFEYWGLRSGPSTNAVRDIHLFDVWHRLKCTIPSGLSMPQGIWLGSVRLHLELQPALCSYILASKVPLKNSGIFHITR